MRQFSLLFLFASLVLLVGCDRDDSVSSDIAVPVVEEYAVEEAASVVNQTGVSFDPFTYPRPVRRNFNNPLNNASDYCTKCVIRFTNPTVYKDSAIKDTVNINLPYFTILYIFGEPLVKRSTVYHCVGFSRSPKSRIGFIADSDVILWSHRLGILPFASNDYARINFYGNEEDARKSFRGDYVEPIAEYKPPKDRPFRAPWLITDMRRIDEETFAYKVCAPGKLASAEEKDDRNENKISQEELQSQVRNSKQYDLFFCIDGTGSMEPLIDNARNGVEQIASYAQEFESKHGVSARFGLAVYRDVGDGDKMYEFYDLSTLDVFLEKLKHIEAKGGDDNPERGYIAAKETLERASWRELSYRNIIIVGDAKWHTGGPSNPDSVDNDDVAKIARNKRTRISLLAVGDGGDELKSQIESLCRSTEGVSQSFGSPSDIASELEADLKRQIERRQQGGDVLEGFARGQDEGEIASSIGISKTEVADIIHILKTQGVDFERFKSRLEGNETIVIDGWVVYNEASMSRECYLFRYEADAIKALVGSLKSQDASVGVFGALAQVAFGSRSGDVSVSNQNGDYRNSGLPYGPESIMRHTKTDIMEMPDAKRVKLMEEIDKKLRKFDEYCNDNSRWTATKDPTGWIPEKAFP